MEARTLLLLKILTALVALTLVVNVYLLISGDSPNLDSSGDSYLGSIGVQDQQNSENPPASSDLTESIVTVKNHGSSSTSGSASSDNAYQSAVQLSKCLSKFGMSINTIIFYYEGGEAHSENMKSLVDSLNSTYRFYYLNQLWNASYNSCFGFSGNVPAFLCAGGGQRIVGEVSRGALEGFARDC